MNFNRVEFKWSQVGIKAIKVDFKITPHVNVTYRPKEVRQVTHILRRVLNFSTKRKINSPRSYIQWSVTSKKSSAQGKKRPKSKSQAELSQAKLSVPSQSCSPSLPASPYTARVLVLCFCTGVAVTAHGSAAELRFPSRGMDAVLSTTVQVTELNLFSDFLPWGSLRYKASGTLPSF